MVNEACVIDKKNGIMVCQDAIQKKMENVKIAFQIIPEDEKPPNGFQDVNCYMVFDIKMEDFQRKVCLVAVGHMTHTPDIITYSSVVMRETVCIALTMVALHDLEVKAANVLNTNVMVLNCENIWTVLDAGKSAVIVKALYRLKSAGASFRAHLAQCMQEFGYCSCNSDPNLWMKAQYKPENKLEYYSYILCHVDDILCIHHDPDNVLNKLIGCMSLKPGSVGSPNMSLGMKLKHMHYTMASGLGL